MTDYHIEPMTRQELNILNSRHQRQIPYAEKRTSGWKLFTEGLWHYGFTSVEQAEWAMEHRSTPEESYYVKEGASIYY